MIIELMRQMTEEQDPEKRMTIVTENKETLEKLEAVDVSELESKITDLESSLGEKENQLKELTQKYNDAFWNSMQGTKKQNDDEEKQPETEIKLKPTFRR